MPTTLMVFLWTFCLTEDRMTHQLNKRKAVSVLMEPCCMTLAWTSAWKPVVSSTASLGCMFVSSLFPSCLWNIDLTVCSAHTMYSRDASCYVTGNGNLFWYFPRLCWSGYDTERGMMLYAFVFQVEAWVGRGEWFPLVQSCFVISQLCVPDFTPVPFNWLPCNRSFYCFSMTVWRNVYNELSGLYLPGRWTRHCMWASWMWTKEGHLWWTRLLWGPGSQS